MVNNRKSNILRFIIDLRNIGDLLPSLNRTLERSKKFYMKISRVKKNLFLPDVLSLESSLANLRLHFIDPNCILIPGPCPVAEKFHSIGLPTTG